METTIVYWGLYWDNGKENGSYYNGVILGGCRTDGPLLGTLNIRCRIRIRIQKGTINLTTTLLVFIQCMGCELF